MINEVTAETAQYGQKAFIINNWSIENQMEANNPKTDNNAGNLNENSFFESKNTIKETAIAK